jgi:hypothetical protein
MVEQVTLKCTSNGRTAPANVVSITKDLLRVYLPGSDTMLSMVWQKDQYVGNKAGLEFTSTGKVVRG